MALELAFTVWWQWLEPRWLRDARDGAGELLEEFMSGETEKPAFPSIPSGLFKGLSLREYAAVAAMKSMRGSFGGDYEEYAKDAVAMADALIAELEKTQT